MKLVFQIELPEWELLLALGHGESMGERGVVSFESGSPKRVWHGGSRTTETRASRGNIFPPGGCTPEDRQAQIANGERVWGLGRRGEDVTKFKRNSIVLRRCREAGGCAFPVRLRTLCVRGVLSGYW